MKFFNKTSLVLILSFTAFLLLQSCSGNDPFKIDYSESPAPYNTSEAVRDTTLAGGVHIFVVEEGEGPFSVVPKDIINIRYTGRKMDGKIFAGSFSSRNTSPLFLNTFSNLTPFPLGNTSPLVEGLRKGLIGMKEGERRTIIVPPDMGYTDEYLQSARGLISPIQNGFNLQGETLTYDVELIEIQNIQ